MYHREHKGTWGAEIIMGKGNHDGQKVWIIWDDIMSRGT